MFFDDEDTDSPADGGTAMPADDDDGEMEKPAGTM